MKKLTTYLFMLTLLIACGGGDDAGGGGSQTGGSEYLNVSNVDIPGGNTTATLNIQASNNCEWVISWTESWIRSISPTTGRGNQNATITLTVNPSSTAARTAIVTVKNTSGTITRNITITQAANAEQLTVSPTTMNFEANGGTQEITVTSNTAWSITGKADWFDCDKTSGTGSSKVTVTVKANTGTDARDAILTFKGDNMTVEVKVHQAAPQIDFYVTTPTSLSIGALAESVSISVAGNANWVVQSNREWAIPSVKSGQGEQTFSVALTDNTTEQTRQAEITISVTGKAPVVVTITQSAGSRPVVSNLQLQGVEKTEAELSFAYTSLFPVTSYGLCYSKSANPTVENSTVVQANSNNVMLTGLTPGTDYHVRAFATSAVGTGYSDEITFTTIKGEQPNPGDNPQPGW